MAFVHDASKIAPAAETTAALMAVLKLRGEAEGLVSFILSRLESSESVVRLCGSRGLRE